MIRTNAVKYKIANDILTKVHRAISIYYPFSFRTIIKLWSHIAREYVYVCVWRILWEK